MDDQRQRIKVPPDNYGRMYIAILQDKTLSCHAKLCYATMWAFGVQSQGRCWAGLKAIAEWMSVSKPTVIKAQDELQSAGWIEFVEKAKQHGTTSWQLLIPEVNEVYHRRFRGKRPLPLNRPEVNAVDTKEELEPKKESTPTVRPEIPWLQSYRQKWTAKFNAKYANESGAVKEILKKQAEGFTLADFEARADVYLALIGDDYVTKSNWSILILLRFRWNQVGGIPKNRPTCYHPVADFKAGDRNPKTGDTIGSCGKCGKKVLLTTDGRILGC